MMTEQRVTSFTPVGTRPITVVMEAILDEDKYGDDERYVTVRYEVLGVDDVGELIVLDDYWDHPFPRVRRMVDVVDSYTRSGHCVTDVYAPRRVSGTRLKHLLPWDDVLVKLCQLAEQHGGDPAAVATAYYEELARARARERCAEMAGSHE